MTNPRASKAVIESDTATAAYLVSLLEELAPLAQRSGLPVVAYLLDMALMEAKAAASQSAQPHDRSG